MSSVNKKWLYIPIEIKVRELPAKLLLAAAAANAGYQVILGRKSDLSKYIGSFPPGLFLAFGAQKNFTKEYSHLKKQGFTVAIMDEEGLVTFSDEMYTRLRLSDDTLDKAGLVLTWGENQKQIIAKTHPETMPALYKTGNMRFDILRSEFRHLLSSEVNSIKQRFGRTILMNSSFGSCNHFDGKEQYFSALKTKKILQNEADAKFYTAYFDLKEKVFNAYLDVIPRIAREFPNHTIIIRPHPSENYQAWASAAEGSDNVKIIHEGNVHPWLIACDAVIHHFCTTALEAFASETPAIGYRPFKNDDIETDFVYKGSLPAETPEDLIQTLHTLINGDLCALHNIRKNQRDALKHAIENIDGAFAYEKILDAFNKHTIESTATIAYGKIYCRKLKTHLGDVYRFLKRGMRPYQKNYLDHKFPALDASEIETIFKSIKTNIPGAETLNVKKIAKLCFLITKT